MYDQKLRKLFRIWFSKLWSPTQQKTSYTLDENWPCCFNEVVQRYDSTLQRYIDISRDSPLGRDSVLSIFILIQSTSEPFICNIAASYIIIQDANNCLALNMYEMIATCFENLIKQELSIRQCLLDTPAQKPKCKGRTTT